MGVSYSAFEYELGKEFTEFFPPGYIGPTHFTRLNMESNLKKYPELFSFFGAG